MDLRLWRAAVGVRRLLVVVVISGLVTGGLIVAQASQVAGIVHAVYMEHLGWRAVRLMSRQLLAVLVARALVAGISETVSLNLATDTQIRLRERLFEALLAGGPLTVNRLGAGPLMDTAIQGIEDLEVFLARYLPQIVFTACVPCLVWIQVVRNDWISGAILLATLPLIPFFMYLIGKRAEAKSQQQWHTLHRLSGHFLDVLSGLDTLQWFGRSRGQIRGIAEASETFRVATMANLRVAFLSGMVLELLASLSMGFVAVAVGLRLMLGVLSFRTAFMLLLLVPEFYLPWRALGAKFHDGLKGLTAARQLFDMLEAAMPAFQGTLCLAGKGPWPLTFKAVTFTYPGRTTASLCAVDCEVPPGRRIALVGPSGAGKTTFVHLLLGLGRYQGAISVDGVELSLLDPGWWHRQVAWVTQHPYLFEGTVADNLRLVRPGATTDELERALHLARAWEFIINLPQGWDTPLGQNGYRLSGGERQRIALSRAFLQDTPYVVLDEPTQSLDLDSESALAEALRDLTRGRSALMIAHRLRTVLSADRIMVLDAGRVIQAGSPGELMVVPGPFRQMLAAYQGGGEADGPSNVLQEV